MIAKALLVFVLSCSIKAGYVDHHKGVVSTTSYVTHHTPPVYRNHQSYSQGAHTGHSYSNTYFHSSVNHGSYGKGLAQHTGYDSNHGNLGDYHGYNNHGGFDESQLYHDPPKYEFKYGIEDPNTGDAKNHYEIRDGEVVKGQYSLIDADGSLRTVEYTSDPHHGFRAIVHKSGQESVSYGH